MTEGIIGIYDQLCNVVGCRYNSEYFVCSGLTMGTSKEDSINCAFEAIARREAHELQLQQKTKNKNNNRFLEKNRVEGSASKKCGNQEAANTPVKKGYSAIPCWFTWFIFNSSK